MFQDEKTVELDLSNPSETRPASIRKEVRWTEHQTVKAPITHSTSQAVALDKKHAPLLLKLAAAVTILILSIWLF